MSNELSELQAIDFAVGGFITKAFDGLSLTTGPKEWREFLARATSAQVYRHDAASPADFVKVLQSSRKAETGAANKRLNAPPLPAVYYYRKPGFTNVNDRSKQVRGRYSWSDDLQSVYNIRALHLDLDYQIVFVAWDKPSLDKLCMAWYAYVVTHDTMTAQYQIGSTVMDVPVTLQDHCNLTISDSSEIAENGAKLFSASAPYTVHTMIFFGAEIPPPSQNMRLSYGLNTNEIRQVVAGYGDGVTTDFIWLTDDYRGYSNGGGFDVFINGILIARWDGTKLIAVDGFYTVNATMTLKMPPSLNIVPPPPEGAILTFDMATGILYMDGVAIAFWDGNKWVSADGTYTVTGACPPDFSSVTLSIVPPPPEGATVTFDLDSGISFVGAGCPTCHKYGVCLLPDGNARL